MTNYYSARKVSVVILSVLRYRLSSDLQNYFRSRCTGLHVGLYAPRPLTKKKHSATMADAMEIVPNEGIPALPPLPRVAPVLHAPGEGDGQNWPSASAGIAVAEVVTPQPR